MAPPIVTLPSFADGQLVHAADLTAITTDVDALCQITTGKTAASGVSSKPLCVLSAGGVAIPQGTIVVLSWSTAVANTDGMWVSGSVVTVQTAGWYRVVLQVPWVAPLGAGGYRALIFINGTVDPTNTAALKDEYVVASGKARMQVHLYDRFAAGTTIRAAVEQDSTASQSVDGSFGGPQLAVAWDAPY